MVVETQQNNLFELFQELKRLLDIDGLLAGTLKRALTAGFSWCFCVFVCKNRTLLAPFCDIHH
jgi:hypothetical protein